MGARGIARMVDADEVAGRRAGLRRLRYSSRRTMFSINGGVYAI